MTHNHKLEDYGENLAIKVVMLPLSRPVFW